MYNTKRVGIPYYYLGENDKSISMQRVAATYSSNGHILGDVISYAKSGVPLVNGNYARGNICFYGIVDLIMDKRIQRLLKIVLILLEANV